MPAPQGYGADARVAQPGELLEAGRVGSGRRTTRARRLGTRGGTSQPADATSERQPALHSKACERHFTLQCPCASRPKSP